MDDKIKNAYKTYSNCLGKFNYYDLLYAVWEYEKLLPHIRNTRKLTYGFDYGPAISRNNWEWLHGWELEKLVVETILHSRYFGKCKNPSIYKDFAYIFSRQQEFSKLLEDGCIELMHKNNNLLRKYMTRLPFLQTEWQTDFTNNELMYRYYSIYSHPKINDIIKDSLGFSYEQFYIFIFVTWFNFTKKFSYKIPIFNEVQKLGITREMALSMQDLLVVSFETIKEKLKISHVLNETYGYVFNPLRDKPLISLVRNNEDILICPIPEFITWKGTKGFYYHICNSKNIENSLGIANASYIEKVAKKLIPNKILCCDKLYKVGKSKKQTSDIILEDDGAYLFIECKAKRLQITAKAELYNNEQEDSELNKIANGVVQVYKTIMDAENGFYEKSHVCIIDIQKPKYICITTMEDWFLFADRYDKLKIKVKDKLESIPNMNVKIKEYHFIVISNSDFELLSLVLKNTHINEVFECYFKHHNGHFFSNYLINKFGVGQNFIFQNENNRLIESIVAKLKS